MRDVTRRVTWGFLDQVFSSGSNFALSAFVAATISAAGFGAFTVVYAIYNVVVGLSGGLASLPLVVRFSAATPDELRRATRASVGAALALGTVAGILCLAIASLTSSAIGDPLRALAVTMPGLLAQDAWRYSFVAGGQPAKAAANDILWIVLQLLGIAVLLMANAMSSGTIVLVWGGAASAAALLGIWQARLTPAPRRALTFLREQRSLSWRYAVEAVVHRSGSWLALTFVAAIAGLQVVGALRGAVLLIGGPLNLLFVGATFAFVAEGVRLLRYSPGSLSGAVRSVSVATTGTSVVWCIIVLSLPDEIGSHLLGATWPQAKSLLPMLVPFIVALGASMGPTQGMLALGAAKRSLFTQIVPLAVLLPSITAAAVIDGARGAAVAMGVTSVLRTGLAWVQFRRALREHMTSVARKRPEHAVQVATAR